MKFMVIPFPPFIVPSPRGSFLIAVCAHLNKKQRQSVFRGIQFRGFNRFTQLLGGLLLPFESVDPFDQM